MPPLPIGESPPRWPGELASLTARGSRAAKGGRGRLTARGSLAAKGGKARPSLARQGGRGALSLHWSVAQWHKSDASQPALECGGREEGLKVVAV